MGIDPSIIRKQIEAEEKVKKSSSFNKFRKFKKIATKVGKGIGKDASQIGKGARRIAQKVRIPLPKGEVFSAKIRKTNIKAPLLTKYGDITANTFFRRKNGNNR